MKELTFDGRIVNITGPLVRGLYCPSSQKLIKKDLYEITVVKAKKFKTAVEKSSRTIMQQKKSVSFTKAA